MAAAAVTKQAVSLKFSMVGECCESLRVRSGGSGVRLRGEPVGLFHPLKSNVGDSYAFPVRKRSSSMKADSPSPSVSTAKGPFKGGGKISSIAAKHITNDSRQDLTGKNVVVMGLGASGRRAVKLALAQGAIVVAVDSNRNTPLVEEASFLEKLGDSVKKGIIGAAVAACVALPQFPVSPAAAIASPDPVYSELGVLISGPPIKDANALLRYALPISNKPIKEIQRTLEGITDALKLPGVKAIDPVERDVRQASRLFSQNKESILADVAEAKKEETQKVMGKLSESLVDFQDLLAQKDRAAILPKQKECLEYVGDIEEAMVEKFPYEIPAEYEKMPLLKGRAKVEMKVRVKDNPNLKNAVFEMTVDGYTAPVTAGNFIDLVERRFYDNMEIQRADGFVVQTGDPDGPAEGFVDPETGKIRTIPLEIMVEGDKGPIYGGTLEELGRFREQTKLPFNAFGTLAMAREEFEPDSASSQIFWLLKESELTPSNANILDGTYSVFGYVTENQDFLADLKVGDVIESIRVTSGLDNLVNPSYKVGGA